MRIWRSFITSSFTDGLRDRGAEISNAGRHSTWADWRGEFTKVIHRALSAYSSDCC